MKAKNIILQTFTILLFSCSLKAQQVSKDSINMLNQQKEAIETTQKVNERKLELAKLENDLAEKIKQSDKTAQEAQKSADENRDIASRLERDSQNKKLSNQASKAARQAERNAKAARKAADGVDDLRKDIASLQAKIAEDEAKLGNQAGVLTGAVQPAQATTPDQQSARVSVAQQNAGPAQNTAPTQNPATTPNIYPATINSVPAVSNSPYVHSVTEKALEATYKNYPQQPGQPTIIINNIVIPSNYDGAKTPPAATGNVQINPADQQDYDDFKAWQRSRQERRYRDPMPERDRDAYRDMNSEVRDDSRSSDKLTFQQRFGERPARNSGLWVIPMVGLHASNFNADVDKGKADGRIGWNAGLDFRMHAKRFFFQPGVHYFSSSMRVTSEDSISDAPLLNGPRMHSLKVPVMLGLYLTKANKGFFKMNIKGGATGTYLLAVDKSNLAQFDKDNIEEYSYGLNAGLGLEFGLLTLDFSHEWGMSRLFKDGDIKNNVLRATVGIKL